MKDALMLHCMAISSGKLGKMWEMYVIYSNVCMYKYIYSINIYYRTKLSKHKKR
jgi:hypothetical protein